MEETSKVTKSRVHHGFNISIARNRKGLKQAALADMLGISQQRGQAEITVHGFLRKC